MSRLATATKLSIFSTVRPFSGFEFAEDNFSGSAPIRRLFSIGRTLKGKTIIVEDVPAECAVVDENAEIVDYFPDYKPGGVKRISFWRKSFSSKKSISTLRSQDCIGYAILKRDTIPSKNLDSWHVFEAVIKRYPHHHNYCPANHKFQFRVGGKEFSVRGSLYAQQNELNKACAQVALRSVCATYLGRPEITYREINSYAKERSSSFTPGTGLSTVQIAKVLEGFGIPYFELNYKAAPARLRNDFPYEKIIYSGIESGAGSLLAFSLSGPNAPSCGHIIPCFGHTFNEDAWGPHADDAYFKIGETIRYVPSRAWMSSFIVHDDNFGSNLCIPQAFVKPLNADYVVELLPKGYAYSETMAEIVAADYFYPILPVLLPKMPLNPWMRRLVEYVLNGKLILRCVAASKKSYLRALGKASDWEGNQERAESLDHLQQLSPDRFWMVEVSVPEVFSTNKRKLGEILLDAENPLSDRIDFTSFVLARFPESYIFFDKLDASTGEPRFLLTPSDLKSHVPLLTR